MISKIQEKEKEKNATIEHKKLRDSRHFVQVSCIFV